VHGVRAPLGEVLKRKLPRVTSSREQHTAMREIVHIQGGQCGNQIGAKFWEVRSVVSFAGGAPSAERQTQRTAEIQASVIIQHSYCNAPALDRTFAACAQHPCVTHQLLAPRSSAQWLDEWPAGMPGVTPAIQDRSGAGGL
jgi:hypothetical protein